MDVAAYPLSKRDPQTVAAIRADVQKGESYSVARVRHDLKLIDATQDISLKYRIFAALIADVRLKHSLVREFFKRGKEKPWGAIEKILKREADIKQKLKSGCTKRHLFILFYEELFLSFAQFYELVDHLMIGALRVRFEMRQDRKKLRPTKTKPPIKCFSPATQKLKKKTVRAALEVYKTDIETYFYVHPLDRWKERPSIMEIVKFLFEKHGLGAGRNYVGSVRRRWRRPAQPRELDGSSPQLAPPTKSATWPVEAAEKIKAWSRLECVIEDAVQENPMPTPFGIAKRLITKAGELGGPIPSLYQARVHVRQHPTLVSHPLNRPVCDIARDHLLILQKMLGEPDHITRFAQHLSKAQTRVRHSDIAAFRDQWIAEGILHPVRKG